MTGVLCNHQTLLVLGTISCIGVCGVSVPVVHIVHVVAIVPVVTEDVVIFQTICSL